MIGGILGEPKAYVYIHPKNRNNCPYDIPEPNWRYVYEKNGDNVIWKTDETLIVRCFLMKKSLHEQKREKETKREKEKRKREKKRGPRAQ